MVEELKEDDTSRYGEITPKLQFQSKMTSAQAIEFNFKSHIMQSRMN